MTVKRSSTQQTEALGPLALRNGGVDLGFLKRWDIEHRSLSSPITGDEAIEASKTQTVLIITYRDGTRDEFTGETAQLLLAHLSDHAASSFWNFRPETPYPTPSERAHQAWTQWHHQPKTYITFVRILERCIHGALQADEQRRMLLQQLPVPENALQAHALATALEQAFRQANQIQCLAEALNQIGEITTQEGVRMLVETTLSGYKDASRPAQRTELGNG